MGKKQKRAHRTYSRFPEGHLVWAKFWKNARRTAQMAAGEAPSSRRATKYQRFVKLQRLDRPMESFDLHSSVDQTLGSLLGTAMEAATGNGFRIDDPWVLEALVRAAAMLNTRLDHIPERTIQYARASALAAMVRPAVTSNRGTALLSRIGPASPNWEPLQGDVFNARLHAEAAPEDSFFLYWLLRTIDQDREEAYNDFARDLLKGVIAQLAAGRRERRHRARAAFDAVERATAAFIEALDVAKSTDFNAHGTSVLRA